MTTAEIVRTLLTRAHRFEPNEPVMPLTAGLTLLGSLEPITRASLPSTAPTTTPPTVASPPTQAVKPKPAYSTAHDEYRPALGSGSIIDALLDFHRKDGTLHDSTKNKSVPLEPKFSPVNVPQVDVRLKNSPILGRRTSLLAKPVLRPGGTS